MYIFRQICLIVFACNYFNCSREIYLFSSSFMFFSCLCIFQNNTMKILFMYHNLKPQRGSITPGSLPSPSEAFKHVIPVFLTQRSINSSTLRNQKHLEFIDLKNEDAQLPYLDETVHWCKMFKLSQFSKKNHIVRVCYVLYFVVVYYCC